MCIGGGSGGAAPQRFAGGGAVPQAPDLSGQANASSAIGNEASAAGTSQLGWAKGQVGNNTATNSGVQSDLTPQIGTDVNANAAGASMYGSTLGGLGDQLKTAQAYGGVEGQNTAAAGAQAATGAGFDAARANNMRQLGSYGVDPSQMKSGALNLNANMAEAGAVGNAGFQAGQQRQLTGMGLTSSALNENLMASNVGQGYGAGANATGGNVAGIGNSTLGAGSAALSDPSKMMNTGLSGQSTAANIENTQFNDQMKSYEETQKNANSMMSSIGSIAGMAGGAMIGGPMGASLGASLGGAAGKAMGDGGGAIPGRYNSRPGMDATVRSDGWGGLPGSADGGQQKRPDYGNPGVIPSRGVPPQVGIPGPWLAGNGGAPPGMVQQGPSDGSGIDDQIHAKISVGEYIIPADVVHAKGKEFFDMLLKKYHVPAQQQRQQMGAH
jgi:hypothetical protein